MKIAVTGANGFVGRNLVDFLVHQGDEVTAVTWVNDPIKTTFANQAKCQESDFSREALKKNFQGVDAVVHLAGLRQTPQADAAGIYPYLQANVMTTENIIIAAGEMGVAKICQASSIAVYYPTINTLPYTEHQAPVPLTLYGASKIACENLGYLYARRYVTQITALRFAQIYGPGDREGLMMMKFINQARAKQSLIIVGEGKITRDYLYLKDAVEAITKAIMPGAPDGIFNIGGGRGYSVREIAETVNEVFDNQGNIIFNASEQETGASYYMDCTKANHALGWQSQWPLHEGLEDMKKRWGKLH